MDLINKLSQDSILIGNLEKESLENQILCFGHEIKENKKRKNTYKITLLNNLKMKQSLQKEMEAIKDEKQREIVKLQTSLRSLKLEQMDLYNENKKYKQIAFDFQNQSENKDQIIICMQNEIDLIKMQLTGHQVLTNNSQENLSKIQS